MINQKTDTKYFQQASRSWYTCQVENYEWRPQRD